MPESRTAHPFIRSPCRQSNTRNNEEKADDERQHEKNARPATIDGLEIVERRRNQQKHRTDDHCSNDQSAELAQRVVGAQQRRRRRRWRRAPESPTIGGNENMRRGCRMIRQQPGHAARQGDPADSERSGRRHHLAPDVRALLAELALGRFITRDNAVFIAVDGQYEKGGRKQCNGLGVVSAASSEQKYYTSKEKSGQDPSQLRMRSSRSNDTPAVCCAILICHMTRIAFAPSAYPEDFAEKESSGLDIYNLSDGRSAWFGKK